jgi:hypothetical protein
MITSGGNRNPAKLELNAGTRRGRRRIDQACRILLSTHATVPLDPPSPDKAWIRFPQDGNFGAQHQEFDVLGSAVAGELGQHLQHLAQQQVHQRHVHARQRDSHRIVDVGQSRTSTCQTGFVSPTGLIHEYRRAA